MDRRKFAQLSAGMVAGALIDSTPARALSGVTVTVQPKEELGLLPSFGLGFSGEKHLIRVGRFYTPANKDFTALCNRLGPQVLRIGGTHVDHTKWDPKGRGGVDMTLSPADVKSFADYVHSIGWKVVYGVNMATTPAKETADEARYAADYLGDALVAFEIGNEPDLYVMHHDRASGYNYGTFLGEWKKYFSAIREAVPNARFSGPGAFGRWREYGIPFANDEAANIVLLTQHYYRMGGDKPGATMEALLSGMQDLFAEMQGMVSAASKNKIMYGFRMIETNTFVGGGLPDVSDRMVAALWTVAYALRAAEMGVNGLNFQIGPMHSSNSPLAMGADHPFVPEVRPEYYGMAFVADMGHGRMLRTSISGAPERVTAYCMQTAQGERNIVLNNLTDKLVQGIRIDTASAAVKAGTMLLTGKSLLAKDCTLGGSKIGDQAQGDAKWDSLSGSAGIFTVDLPAASALRLRCAVAG
jgi:hypothetical protein